VIGVTFDGSGYGLDEATGEATAWGGEFLVGDYRGCRRAARLRYVGLPGGDKAAREPWRMAAAHLLDAGEEPAHWLSEVPAAALRAVESMCRSGCQTPRTSSAGRLFDALAALAGVRLVAGYEGQAALELEGLADGARDSGRYPWEITAGRPGLPDEIDTRPLIRAAAGDVRQGIAPAIVARRFHNTLVDLAAETCLRIRGQTGLNAVVLSGGVFCNALLSGELPPRLAACGFRVFRHRRVPPNDGGLSLGQLAIGAALVAGRAADGAARFSSS
jgi:hydrogenase maturation protein HypF